MKNILLTGATGFIGRHLISALLKEGHHITACSRNPDRLQDLQGVNLTVVAIDFSKAISPHDWIAHLEGIDVVINAAGIITETATQSFNDIHTNAPVALFNACVEANVNRVIQISVLGADAQTGKDDVATMSHYHQSKQAADDVLMSLPLDWWVLRPSIIYGDGAKSMGLFRALSMLPIVLLVGSGKQFIQPIHIDNVVASTLISVASIDAKKQLDLVGSSVISYVSFMQKIRDWLSNSEIGLSSKLRSINLTIPLATTLSKVGRWINEPSLNPQSINMLAQSKVYNVAAVEKHLQRSLPSFDHYLQHNPATQAQRWHSRVYFLRPIMRFFLAVVWVWTGVVSAFLYPQDQSYQLLSAVGISGAFLPVMLYSAVIIDVVLGFLVLFAWRVRLIAQAQIGLILVYTIIISIALPEFWLHPFGPILKNIPLLVYILIWSTLEEQKP